MEFKILAPFQTENRFFRDNVNTGWQIEKPLNTLTLIEIGILQEIQDIFFLYIMKQNLI